MKDQNQNQLNFYQTPNNKISSSQLIFDFNEKQKFITQPLTEAQLFKSKVSSLVQKNNRKKMEQSNAEILETCKFLVKFQEQSAQKIDVFIDIQKTMLQQFGLFKDLSTILNFDTIKHCKTHIQKLKTSSYLKSYYRSLRNIGQDFSKSREICSNLIRQMYLIQKQIDDTLNIMLRPKQEQQLLSAFYGIDCSDPQLMQQNLKSIGLEFSRKKKYQQGNKQLKKKIYKGNLRKIKLLSRIQSLERYSNYLNRQVMQKNEVIMYLQSKYEGRCQVELNLQRDTRWPVFDDYQNNVLQKVEMIVCFSEEGKMPARIKRVIEEGLKQIQKLDNPYDYTFHMHQLDSRLLSYCEELVKIWNGQQPVSKQIALIMTKLMLKNLP